MRITLVKLARPVFVLVLFTALIFTSFSYADTATGAQPLVINYVEKAEIGRSAKRSLKLITINLAHGRKDSWNQWLVNEKNIRENLDDIARFLERVGADVVALQEADGPSRWSGGFNHVAYLAEKAGFPFYIQTEHAQITMGNYGTAILSRMPIREAVGFTFPPSWPTTNKGFTLAQIEWPNPDAVGEAVVLDVISVHLDFSRKSVRKSQLEELVALIKPRQNLLAILGDFNSQWLAKKYTVDSFSDVSPVHVFDANSENLNTYKDKRLDWIILSRGLEFITYENEPSLLSDHKAVIATIEFSEEEQ